MSYMNEEINILNLLCITKGDKNEIVESDSYGGFLKLEDYTIDEYDDKVILNGDVFKKLFITPRHKAKDNLKRLAVIKITNIKNGKSIHRAFLGMKGIEKLNEKQVALSRNSIRLLCGEEGHPEYIDSVTISKGSWLKYYWYHPFHATRISMRIGMISLAVGLLSFAVSMICLILCK